MAVSKQQKQESLKELIEKFKRAKSIIFTDFRGLNVKQVGKLRNELRQNDVEYKVAKKTLMRLAAKEAGFKDIPDENLEGPISAAFSYSDEIAGAKIIHKFGKEFEGLVMTGGIMEGESFGAAKAKQLAMIPSRLELYAKLIGTMLNPVRGFHGVLHGTLRKFVATVKALEESKQ